MRASDLTRRGLLSGLLATSSMATAQAFRPGRAAGFRSGFSFLGALVADTAQRFSYAVDVTAAATSAVVGRWADTGRNRLWVRNPAGSPGNIQVGTKGGTNNYAIDFSSFGSLLGTVLPGFEMLITTTDAEAQQIILLRSDQASGSVPANLVAQVEVEVF